MDEALRALARGEGADEDWAARAVALRRAGRGVEALRAVQAAVRAERLGAREFLEDEFPLAPSVEAALRCLREAEGFSADAPGVSSWAAASLLAWGDPRGDAQVAAWVAEDPALLRDDPWFRQRLREGLREANLVARLLRLFGEDALLVSELVQLTPRESGELVEGVLQADEPSLALRLVTLHLLFRSGGELSLAGPLVASASTRLERRTLERAAAAERRAHLPGGLPRRPAWVDPLLRDPVSLSLSRSALRPGFAPPGGSLRLPASPWVVYLDLDRLMSYNDVYGFQRGDELLAEVGCALSAVCGDRVVRWGGDEWVVPWEGSEDPTPLIEEALAALGARDDLAWEHEGERRPLSFSAGVARRRVGEEDLALLHRVDEACYEAKRAGRARVVRAED